MSIPAKVKSFQLKQASQLKKMAQLLDQANEEVQTYPIYQASQQLEDLEYVPSLRDGTKDDNYWGYNIEGFTLPITTIRHIRPKGITNANALLDMSLIADYREWETLSDPLLALKFRVVIKGIGDREYTMGFHIDRHDESQTSTEPHPVYHLQYVANASDMDDSEFSYGSILHLDTPRIMHYPMDFILGIGFLTTNFCPEVFEKLRDSPEFTSLYQSQQERIWQPYAHAMASHWNTNVNTTAWKATQLCPYLL